MSEHIEPPAVRRGDIQQALEIAATLRNVCDLNDGEDGETPLLVERGAPPNTTDCACLNLWEPRDWRIDLHVGCGDICPVLASVPNDPQSGGPDRNVAEAIAMAGEIIMGLVERLQAAEHAAEATTHHAGITASRQGPLEATIATLRTLHAEVVATHDAAFKAGWLNESNALEWVIDRLAKALGEERG